MSLPARYGLKIFSARDLSFMQENQASCVFLDEDLFLNIPSGTAGKDFRYDLRLAEFGTGGYMDFTDTLIPLGSVAKSVSSSSMRFLISRFS